MLLALCCLTFTPQPANYINWTAIEHYTIYNYEYDYGEQSGMVGMLQHWLEMPVDNIYGRRTYQAHRQLTMENGYQLPIYDIPVVDKDFGLDVEQWRSLVTQAVSHYGGNVESDVPKFLQIMKCESNGNPNAYNELSGASGLMQHLNPPYWEARARSAGYPGVSPFNAEANIYASAYLIYRSPGSWQHWVCQ